MTSQLAELRNKVTLNRWYEDLKMQKQSGLTIDKWCSENHISRSCYYYRYRRVLKAIECRLSETGGQEAVQFVALPEAAPESRTEPATIRLRLGELEIEISTGASRENIYAVIEALNHYVDEAGRTCPTAPLSWWRWAQKSTSATPIVLFRYERDRRHDRPKDFLDGFRGYLHSDGYDAYHKLENVISVGCLAHVRRKFVEAVEAAGKSKGSSNLAGKAVKDLQQIFDWDSSCANMTLEERYQKRLEKQKPFLEAFFDWVESISVSEKSALGRARTYALGQKEYVLNVYKDKRLELSNNRAERTIKPFVIGRKNWLFANTPKGAEDSAILYSLVETAKETGIDPYQYFIYALTEAAKLRAADECEKIAELTPAHFKKLAENGSDRG